MKRDYFVYALLFVGLCDHAMDDERIVIAFFMLVASLICFVADLVQGIKEAREKK